MNFDVIKFYSDYGIRITTKGKHITPGWLNTDCPFCGGHDGHLGVHISSGAVKCWRCGPHGMLSVIMSLLNVDYTEANEIHQKYKQSRRTKYHTQALYSPYTARKGTCEYPTGTSTLRDRHRAYLRGRGFDDKLLEEIWLLRGTDNIGPYKFRIMAPIIFNGVMVSYQGRDITNKSELRYKACKKEDELIDHQNLVYGLDYVKGDSCVICEGITDVWRLGFNSVSCFGTSFTLAQINLLASRVKMAYTLFDADDSNALAMSRSLAVLLSARGVEVELLDISETKSIYLVDSNKGIDPGNLKQDYADSIMKEIGLYELP